MERIFPEEAPKEKVLNSDPTYEAWKVTEMPGAGALVGLFRSYLRGMERDKELLL